MKEKPEVGKAILFSLVGIVAFILCEIVVTLVIGLLFALFLHIPILKNVVSFIFNIRGDTPDFLALLIGIVAAYNAVVWMISRFCNSKATESLSLEICGITLFVFHVLFFFVNLIGHNGITANILTLIAAFIMAMRGVSMKQ